MEKGKNIMKICRDYKLKAPVYVGDTMGDYNACLEAEVPFIWAAYGFGTPEGFDHKIDSISQILTLPGISVK